MNIPTGLENLASKKFGVVLLAIWGIYQIGLTYEAMAGWAIGLIFVFAGSFVGYQAFADYRDKQVKNFIDLRKGNKDADEKNGL